MKGTEEAVLTGEKCTFLRHMRNTSAEKFVGKFLLAAVTFALAMMFLHGSTVIGIFCPAWLAVWL
jgi:hypothetical protein